MIFISKKVYSSFIVHKQCSIRLGLNVSCFSADLSKSIRYNRL